MMGEEEEEATGDGGGAEDGEKSLKKVGVRAGEG